MMPDMYFTVTIDTEADHSKNWVKSDPLTFKSITEAIPGTLEPLFKKNGASAAYLLTVEVLENEAAVNTLKSLNDCELGTHLHPEYIAPEKKHTDYAGTYSKEFSNNYPLEVERKKIENITRLFKEKIGRAPRAYRGGKFGFSDNTASILADLDYAADTSVTPGISWQSIGGPDFRKMPSQPYMIESAVSGKKLLEVPVSIVFLNGFSRILNRPVWLRPSFNDALAMKKLVDAYLRIYSGKEKIVLNMMFHSMEFYPLASPYSAKLEDCRRLADRIDSIMRYCRDLGAKFCKLSDLREFYK